MSDKAASLMASLTGDGAPPAEAAAETNPSAGASAPSGGDQDLFGDIPIDDSPAPAPATNMDNNSNSIYHDPMSDMPQQQPQQQPQPSSMQNMQQQQPPQNMNMYANNMNANNMNANMNSEANMNANHNYPYPQPPQQQQPMAPNITYADSNSSGAAAPPNTAPSNTTEAPTTASLAPAPAPMPPAPSPAPAKSLLMTSGLLGMAGDSNDEKKADSGGDGGGGDGGLFDDIDQAEKEEEERKQKEAAAAAEEQKRQQEAAAAQEAERQKQEELQRQQQQMQQQQIQNQGQQQPYSLEARMQGMHLNNDQSSYLQQSQQMQQNQMMMQQQPNQMNQMMMQQPNTMNSQMMNSNQPNQMMQQGQGQSQLNQVNTTQTAGQQPNQMMQQQQQQPNQMMHQPPNQMGMNPPGQQNNQMQPQQQAQPDQQNNQMMNQNQHGGQQEQPPSQIAVPGPMFRDHGGPGPGATGGMDQSSMAQSSYGMPPSNNNMPPGSSPNRFHQPSMPVVANAGMNNAVGGQPNAPYGAGINNMGMNMNQPQMMQQQQMPPKPFQVTKPPEVPTYYGKVSVTDPMLLQAPSKLLGMVSAPPHWSYQFTTQIKGQPPSVWMVRRRFRDVVALEDRLRTECPGAILPPRPDKHVSRAIEEASTHQSAEFAWQRAAELEQYLNALAVHPEAFGCQSLKMFLGLQDDMGTAWPEVSANAFTRISTMGASAAHKVAETSSTGFFGTAAPANTTPNQSGGGMMSNVMGQVASSVGVGELAEPITEDSAELLALASSESVRMGAVLQAVPKLEGAVTLLREQGEGAGAVGMELNRLAKEVLSQGDRELSMPLEIFSNGLLRYGRRTKRLGQEIGQATMTSFQMQYKLCRYEKLAWGDRRNALTKRQKERMKANKFAQQLHGHQQQYPYGGGPGGYGGGYGQPGMNQYNGGNQMNQLVSNATMSDNIAVDAVRECDAIGDRLKREVNRVTFSRRMDWARSVKVIASYMKEAASERVAIWESTRDTFLQAFPDYHNDTAQWTNATPSMSSQLASAQQPQQQMNMNMNANNSYMQGSMMGQSYPQQASMQQPQQPQLQPQMYSSMMAATPQGMQQPQAQQQQPQMHNSMMAATVGPGYRPH